MPDRASGTAPGTGALEGPVPDLLSFPAVRWEGAIPGGSPGPSIASRASAQTLEPETLRPDPRRRR